MPHVGNVTIYDNHISLSSVECVTMPLILRKINANVSLFSIAFRPAFIDIPTISKVSTEPPQTGSRYGPVDLWEVFDLNYAKYLVSRVLHLIDTCYISTSVFPLAMSALCQQIPSCGLVLLTPLIGTVREDIPYCENTREGDASHWLSQCLTACCRAVSRHA